MRIISLAPSNTEILYALGLGSDVVALTGYCNFPNEVKQKPKVSGWLDIKPDKIKELNPDLIFTSTFLQDKIIEKLKGICKVVHVDPKTLSDVYESILKIGKETFREKEAEDVINNMKDEFEIVRRDVDGKEIKNVYIEEWHKPPTVSGNWVPDVLEIAGGKSLIPSGVVSRRVTDEEIQKFNPEYIIISICGFGDNISADIVKERENWREINAVKNNKILVINDDYLNRPGPRLTEGAKILSSFIHNL